MIALALAACTFAPGGGFAHLDDVALAAALDPGPARALDDGFATDLGYEVHLSALSLDAGDVELLELSGGGGGGGTFDPADPPDGFGLCHGGHCHADDGSLWSYAEIEAWLAGGDVGFVAVATAPVDDALDLLAGVDRAVPPADPELPLAEIARVTLDTTRLLLSGTVTGGPDGAGVPEGDALDLVVDLPVGEPFGGDLPLSITRTGAAEVAVSFDLVVDGTLLDGVDLASLAVDGAVTVEDPDSAAGAAILAALAEQLPAVTAATDL